MTKSTLESMLKKYHLSTQIEVSIWKVFEESKKLRIAASRVENDLSVIIEYNNFTDISTSEFAVNDTAKLLKMLNALDGDIKMSTRKDNNNKIYSILVSSNNNIEMEYVTADINQIRQNKVVKTFGRKPEQIPQVKIVLDEDFISTYISSTIALPDSEDVVFKMNNDNKLEMIFGHQQGANKTLNTSKIKYLPKTLAGYDTLPEFLGFKAEVLKQILLVNKDAKDPVLELSCYNSPIGYAQFVNGDITATYHIIGSNVK